MKGHSHSHHHKGKHLVVHAHQHKRGGAVKRDKGGRVGIKAAGNRDVFEEAEGKESYSRKRGGRANRNTGGAVMAGGMVRPRLDRPGRKRGGRVGSDMSPLTGAHNVTSSEDQPKENGPGGSASGLGGKS